MKQKERIGFEEKVINNFAGVLYDSRNHGCSS